MEATAAKRQCPEFPYFGASYPDATCIDGYLWDLDKCADGGGLYSTGDNPPCPFCNPQEAFDNLTSCLDYGDQNEGESDEDFEKRSRIELAEHINAFRKRHSYNPFEFDTSIQQP